MKYPRDLTRALSVLVALSSPAVPWAQATRSENVHPFEFRPGVIVAPGANSVYLMKPGGGIEAVALASGRALWTAAGAARPLLLHRHLLIAQVEDPAGAGVLRLAALDTAARGGVVLRFDVPLPEGVSASINDVPDRSFRVAARARGESIILSWTYAESSVTGREPPPGSMVTDRREAGAVELELRNGRVRELGEADAGTGEAGRFPERLARLIEAGQAPASPWWGDLFYLAISPESPSRGIVTIRRWSSDTGDPLPNVSLSTGNATIRYPSADGRHLLASRMMGSSPAGEEDYLWTIFSLETGSQTAQIHNSLPGARFFILGSLLTHELRPVARAAGGCIQWEPPKLRTVDRSSGAEIWTRPFRDTAYRGELPPAPPGRQGSPPGSDKPAPGKSSGQ